LGRFAKEYQGPPAHLLPPEQHSVLDARAARNTIRFFAAAVFVLVVGAVFAFTVTRERGDKPSAPAGRPTTTNAAQAAAADASIGPASSADVGAYLDDRKLALAAATGDRTAVVSLDGYLSEAEARAKVGSLPVQALLAAAPGAHPSVVTGGLEAWAKTQRQADQTERDEISKLLPTVSDPVFKKFYESELVRLDAAIANAAPTAGVVFGLVVKGSAESLRTLATTAGVRLVDVGQAATAAPGAVYKGLRPEETARTDQPATRPI
jgi:hypothetical protein